jgi:hypothetical protein
MNKLFQNHKMICNFKPWFLFLGFIFFVNPSLGEAYDISPSLKKVKTSYNIGVLADKLSRKDLEERLRTFVAASRPSRSPGSKGHQAGRQFILNFLKSLPEGETSVSTQAFTAIAPTELSKNSLDGMNLIWEKKGSQFPDEVILIGAHYDTVLKDNKTKKILFNGEMPGADLNASGVVLAMSLAELFSKLELPRSVKIVFFDYEEIDSQGSKEYAKKWLNEIGTQKLAGFVQLNRLGHDTKINDTEKKFNNFQIYHRSSADKNAQSEIDFIGQLVRMGTKTSPQIKFKLAEISPEATDFHSATSFRSLGFNALTFTQNLTSDPNPRIYSSNDFVETLNFTTYSFAYRFIAASLLGWNFGIVK